MLGYGDSIILVQIIDVRLHTEGMAVLSAEYDNRAFNVCDDKVVGAYLGIALHLLNPLVLCDDTLVNKFLSYLARLVHCSADNVLDAIIG